MTESPEVLQDDRGKWQRRDVFVSECVEDFDVDEEEVVDSLDSLISDGVVRTQELGDATYIQISNVSKAMKLILKNKTKMWKNSAVRYLGGDGS